MDQGEADAKDARGEPVEPIAAGRGRTRPSLPPTESRRGARRHAVELSDAVVVPDSVQVGLERACVASVHTFSRGAGAQIASDARRRQRHDRRPSVDGAGCADGRHGQRTHDPRRGLRLFVADCARTAAASALGDVGVRPAAFQRIHRLALPRQSTRFADKLAD
eukprot:73775-Prymnesium_polylepis.3